MFEWLVGRLTGRRAPQGDATAKDLRRLFGRCPACDRSSFAGHTYAILSVTAEGDPATGLTELIGMIYERRWEELAACRSFDPMKDAYASYVLHCPEGGAWIALLREPFELFDSSHIIAHNPVAAADFEQLAALIEITKPLNG